MNQLPPEDPFAPPVPRDAQPRKGHVFDPVEPIPEAMQPAPEARPRGRLKDFDTSESAYKLKSFLWSGTGAVMGMFLGMFGAVKSEASVSVMLMSMVAGFILGWTLSYLISMGVATAAANGASKMYMPSGSTTPMDRQYSLAQSYVARGRYEEAAAEYKRCAEAYPEDAEPPLRLARLYRDELERHEDAILWFKRTCAVPAVPPGTDMMAMRELIEVYTHRLRTPEAALPHLARLHARHPNTPAGEWAKRELADLKARMREAAE
jgi:hypothetical protein